MASNVRQKVNLLLKNDTLSRRRPIPHPYDEKSSPLLIHEVCVRHWGGVRNVSGWVLLNQKC